MLSLTGHPLSFIKCVWYDKTLDLDEICLVIENDS